MEPESIIRLNREPDGLARYLIIGCVALAGMLTLFFFQWASEGHWLLAKRTRVVELSAQFLPVPFAFLAWVYCMERTEKFKLSFSPVFCILSLECFLAVQMVRGMPVLSQAIFAAALIAGFFVLVPFTDCVRRIRKEPRPALIALFAGLAAFGYYALLIRTWEYVCGAVTQLVSWLTWLFQYDVVVNVQYAGRSISSIGSPHFKILVFEDCSGLEGIFLFSFLLSVMLLMDWELFKRRSVLALYAFGAVYMFFVNALRIFAFFSLGYFAYPPDAAEWLQSLRGVPIFLFHSYVGWVFYLIAFGVFAWWMYRSAARRDAS